MSDVTIGLIGAGAMGAEIGRSLVTSGRRVISVLDGRSEDSRRRANAAGIEPVNDLVGLVGASDIVLSVVPPGAASSVAHKVADAAKAAPVAPVFVDANAISPERARAIASAVEAAGMRYVDGGIIGGPPTTQRPTAVYLSGAGGDELVEMLATPEVRVEWLGPEHAAASAIKMAYAAWTKGTNALVVAIRAMARAEGVEDALIVEWQRSQPSALEWSKRVPATAGKAWRWVAEMEEIAASLDAAGVPAGAFEAAAQIYERLDIYKDVVDPPSLDEMIDRVLKGGRLEP
jgi:3-hydroxyisobutyrate dehydrogenase-like beta-hydroxyacid dehydrogenase